MSLPVKLSSPATREFWEIPVLFEDAHLLALDKPAGLAVSPSVAEPDRPALLPLLHAAIAAGKPWAVARKLEYLALTHQLDAEAGGVLLFAKSKPVLVALTNYLSAGHPALKVLALVYGKPRAAQFEVDAKLAPHAEIPGQMRVDTKSGKKSLTRFQVVESFDGFALIAGEPITELHGGGPLYLSRLKRDYRLKPGREERPLLGSATLHADSINLPHPVTGESLNITAPWPKHLNVALKFLRQYAAGAQIT
jgi:23S rRNA-/tRNA-specific pseudouridylate synthase